MQTRWNLGDAVRVTRNVRNDGTYPGIETGELLIRRGTVGHVVDVGTFLMDQIIYSVHFIDAARIVGCREEELIGGDEAWAPSRFETRDRVRASRALVASGETLVPVGGIGEILRVQREGGPQAIAYHVHFECLPGRTLSVPETALTGLTPGAGRD